MVPALELNPCGIVYVTEDDPESEEVKIPLLLLLSLIFLVRNFLDFFF